jgi:EmrB/QacA subfamily drug resistance transporter
MPSPSPFLPPAGPRALASLALSVLLAAFGTSSVNVALPALAAAFGASFAAVQWVVLAYLLAITTLVVGAGRLGDRLGRRRLLLAGLLLFVVASGLGGVAPNLGVLMAARALQGFGAALMLALTMALVGETVPRARLGGAMGLLGTMSALGTALGPSLGGFILGFAGWRAIVLFNVPLGLAALLLARRHLPPDRPGPAGGVSAFDPAGTLLLALTLAAYTLAVTLGRGQWETPHFLLLAAATLGAVLFVRVETRARQPLVSLSLFRDADLSASLAVNAAVSTVMMATMVVGPFYLSLALGLPAAAVGLVLSAGPAVAALTGMPAGRLVDRWGTHRTALGGLAGMAAGAGLLALRPADWSVASYVASLAILTSGYALFHAANNAAVMLRAGAENRGVIAGLLNLSRNLGLVTGAAVLGAVFAAAVGTDALATASPAAVTGGLRVTFAVATVLIGAATAVLATRGSRLARKEIFRWQA